MKIRNLLFSVLAVVSLCLMCAKFSYAAPVAGAVDTASNNPFKVIANELISFSINGNVGVAGFISKDSDKFVPLLAVQIGTSRSGWFNYGLATDVSDGGDILLGLGGYAGLNMIKVVEKVVKKPISPKAGCTLGWTEMYYFSDTTDNVKGWDKGLFGAVCVVKF